MSLRYFQTKVSNLVLSNRIWRVKRSPKSKEKKQFLGMFESLNTVHAMFIHANLYLTTLVCKLYLFSLVKVTLDCLNINHLGNETSLKRTFR